MLAGVLRRVATSPRLLGEGGCRCRVVSVGVTWLCGSVCVCVCGCRCSICPFMIYGEVMQRWRTAQGVVLRKWPKEESE